MSLTAEQIAEIRSEIIRLISAGVASDAPTADIADAILALPWAAREDARARREYATFWRDDALEAAALIVERYEAGNPNTADMAREIRNLKKVRDEDAAPFLRISKEGLRGKIATDPDIETDAGAMHWEAPAQATPPRVGLTEACSYCGGKGYVPGDPEGALVEDCPKCSPKRTTPQPTAQSRQGDTMSVGRVVTALSRLATAVQDGEKWTPELQETFVDGFAALSNLAVELIGPAPGADGVSVRPAEDVAREFVIENGWVETATGAVWEDDVKLLAALITRERAQGTARQGDDDRG